MLFLIALGFRMLLEQRVFVDWAHTFNVQDHPESFLKSGAKTKIIREKKKLFVTTLLDATSASGRNIKLKQITNTEQLTNLSERSKHSGKGKRTECKKQK